MINADKGYERITSEEQKERSSISGSIKSILDKGSSIFSDDEDFGETCYSEVVSEKTSNDKNEYDYELERSLVKQDIDEGETETKDIKQRTQIKKGEADEKILITNSENELLDIDRERVEIKEKAIISESTNKSLGYRNTR